MVRYKNIIIAFLTLGCNCFGLVKADSTTDSNPKSAIYNAPAINVATTESPESDQSQTLQDHSPSNFSEQARIGKYPRLDQLTQRHLKDRQLRSSTAFIFTILQNTQELRIHQMGGAWNNSCSGLIAPDTLMRDNTRQTLRYQNGTEKNI